MVPVDDVLEVGPEHLVEWRKNRAPGWYRDIGYLLQDVVRDHRYDYKRKGIKPDDPGWHACSCKEWEGYWSGFEPHVADHLRRVAVEAMGSVRPDDFGAI